MSNPPTKIQSVTTRANRNNNFNFLRLSLASLVLLSHAPELVDGDQHREILTRLVGTMSFGGLAVCGFFALSGYLIVQSWQQTPDLVDFIKKRVLRIYPGYIVACLLSAFVVGALGSNTRAYFAEFNVLQFLKSIVVLQVPKVPSVFAGTPYPEVNGALWTISYEFRCYLIVALLGVCGITRKRALWLGISGIVLLLSLAASRFDNVPPHALYGNLKTFMWLTPFFLAGGCLYLCRDHVPYRKSLLVASAVLLVASMFHPLTVQFGMVVFGSYLLVWLAFAKIRWLERFKTYPDVSYGIYLYGWPVQKLLLWYLPSLSPWVLLPLSLGLSWGLGLMSWFGVERPFLRLKPKASRSVLPARDGTSLDKTLSYNPEALSPPKP